MPTRNDLPHICVQVLNGLENSTLVFFGAFIIIITIIVVPKNSNDNSLTGAINCQLTNIPTTNLLSQDLVSDSSWDIYQQEDDCNNGYH